MRERMKEASTWAGLGLIMPAIGEVIANPKNMMAWASIVGGVVAIIKREGQQHGFDR